MFEQGGQRARRHTDVPTLQTLETNVLVLHHRCTSSFAMSIGSLIYSSGEEIDSFCHKARTLFRSSVAKSPQASGKVKGVEYR